MKDGNYVDKEYEEANEGGVTYFLLVREVNFTLWIKKALLPCKW
jgi:hypothetical protein